MALPTDDGDNHQEVVRGVRRRAGQRPNHEPGEDLAWVDRGPVVAGGGLEAMELIASEVALGTEHPAIDRLADGDGIQWPTRQASR